MGNRKKSTALKIVALVTFIAAIIVNALSVLLPLGGLTPSQVSDLYPNLFAPAGLTFSVWGPIYMLLACYTAYQLLSKQAREALTDKINIFFSVSSAANALWVICWHYKIILLTLLLMLVILASLMAVIRFVTSQELSVSERFFLKLPFAVYFGWITIATMANATVLLVSLGIHSFSTLSENLTIIILAAGTLLGMWTGIRFRSKAYLLVFIWAYLGILIRHTTQTGFNMQYPRIVHATIACLVMFACALVGEIVLETRSKN